MEVWNDLRMLVARYLVASEQMERDGPVAHAVRSVGYNSQDEEDEEDEEDEGSSIEEEEHDRVQNEEQDDEEEVAAGADTEDAPAYSNLGAPVEVGPNGYAVEKKEKHEEDDEPEAHAAADGAADGAATDAAGDDAASERVLSRREEKAPAREQPTTADD